MSEIGALSGPSPLCPSFRCIPDRSARYLSGCCWPVDEEARHLQGSHSAKAEIFSALFRLLNLACTRANRRFAAPLQANDRHRDEHSGRWSAHLHGQADGQSSAMSLCSWPRGLQTYDVDRECERRVVLLRLSTCAKIHSRIAAACYSCNSKTGRGSFRSAEERR